MILESVVWLGSMDPGTCFWRTKSARKSMKALGGRGMCEAGFLREWDLDLDLDLDLLVGGEGEGVSEEEGEDWLEE